MKNKGAGCHLNKNRALKPILHKQKKPSIYLAGQNQNRTLWADLTCCWWNSSIDISLACSSLHELDAFFEYLATKSEKRLVLIIDEFPFIRVKFPETLSVLQNKWDNLLKKTRIMLVFCGSSISMMKKYTLDYKSPIYGRRTGQWMVDRRPSSCPTISRSMRSF